MKKIICILIGFLSLWVITAAFALESKANEDFLTLSDIHFTPFVGCRETKPCTLITRLNRAPASQWHGIMKASDIPFSAYRDDTSFPLLTSALAAAKKTALDKHAKLALVLGDTLAHDYRRLYKYYTGDKSLGGYQSFVQKTYQFINSEIAAAFPSIDVYMVVGNNDSYRGDYATQVQGAFFQDQAALWSTLIKTQANRADMRRGFARAGYYAVDLPQLNNIRLIVLNTNVFSSKARGNDLNKVALAQLQWLHQQLDDAKKAKRKVFIAMHIPEGVDVYATLRIRGISLIEFWRSEYIDLFQNEMREFAPQVLAVFAGHLHSDWMQILRYDNLNEIPVTGTPSISPVFGNNPGYKIYTYSPEMQKIIDFSTYYLSLNNKNEWTMEYQFNHVYQANCHNCAITNGISLIHKDGYLADYYKLFYAVSTNSQPIDVKWNPYYWCAIWHVQSDAYKECVA